MSQHFLLSAKARTLSLTEVARLSDDEAYARFKAVRFAENGGEPFCPHCGTLGIYEYACRRILKCKGCDKQFSITTKTIFADRKMSIRDLLMAIAIFVNGANGHAALHLSRELKCAYKTAFVLAHKLRETLGALQTPHKLTGIVEIDGMSVGGHVKRKNIKAERKGRAVRPEKRRSIVSMRERRIGGRTLSFVFRGEHEALATILAHVHPSAKIRTDDGAHWMKLGGHFPDTKVVNHTVAYWQNGVHTNWVESFNGRIRRGEKGVHHKIAGVHLQKYADEFAWREDHRRVDNGMQFGLLATAAAQQPVSSNWRKYWRRKKPTRALA